MFVVFTIENTEKYVYIIITPFNFTHGEYENEKLGAEENETVGGSDFNRTQRTGLDYLSLCVYVCLYA
jgi:hypothetical protein